MQTLSSVLENPVQDSQQEQTLRPLSLGLPSMNLTNSQTLLDTAAEYQKLRAQQDMYDQQNSFVTELMGIYSGTRPGANSGFAGTATATNNKHGLTPGYWAALSAANAAMKAAGLGTFTVTSGFRSDARQAKLYAKSGGSGYVAPPGKSKHRTGNAADLHLTTAQQNWLRQNGAKFGIIAPMWNPTGKRGIVERWHWEYTGR